MKPFKVISLDSSIEDLKYFSRINKNPELMNNKNNNRIYNLPFSKDTKRKVFLLQGELVKVFES